MVGIGAVGDVDVEVHLGGVGERAEGFGDEFDIEGFDFFGGEGDVEDEGGAAGEVEGDGGEGVFHGDGGPAIAENADFVAEGLVEGGAQDQRDVFDGVVVINVGVALGGQGEVDQGVLGEVGEHVVEEGDAGGDGGLAGAIKVEVEGDVGFGGFAGELGGSGHCYSGVIPSTIR